MKYDRICWTAVLSRGVFALMLGGSLVPLCSKCLDACMRANFVLKSLKMGSKLCADCLRTDGPAQMGGRSAIPCENRLETWLSLVGIKIEGRTVLLCWADGLLV